MINLDTVAEFTWLFDQEFFLETAEGNFIWCDPDYGGDNTIRKVNMTLKQYCEHTGTPFGRDKGQHYIRTYCGQEVVFVGE